MSMLKRYKQKNAFLMALLFAVWACTQEAGAAIPGLQSGGVGSFGSGCDGCSAQILDQLVKNGAGDTQGQKLGAKTAKQAAEYQQQQDHIRDGLIQQSEIVRSHPELSELACGIATANMPVPAIKDAGQRAVGEIMTMITNMLAQDKFTGNSKDKVRVRKFNCAMGMLADQTCEKAFNKKVVGAFKNRHVAITQKDSIACDVNSIRGELKALVSNDDYTPSQSNVECLAAIAALTQEFQNTRQFPTQEQMKSDPAENLHARMNATYARAWENMGNLLAAFEARISVPISSVKGANGTDCFKGLKGGNDKGIYELLVDRYGSDTRTDFPPFGMPQPGFCLSERQIEKGKEMMGNYYLANGIGAADTAQMMQDQLALAIDAAQEAMRTRGSIMNATTSAPTTEEFSGGDSARPVQ